MVLGSAIVVGCGPHTMMAAGGGGGSSDEADASDATSLDGSDGDDTGDEAPLTHGVVWLELARSESQAADPFDGTETLYVQMTYLDCLVDFYETHPELRADGVDGPSIFGGAEFSGEGWEDRLCDLDPDDTEVGCRVTDIEQQLDGGTPTLSVLYTVFGAVEGRRLATGPFPTPQTAACMGGGAPQVRVEVVIGGGPGTKDLWTAESFSPTTAVVDQDTPITIFAAAS